MEIHYSFLTWHSSIVNVKLQATNTQVVSDYMPHITFFFQLSLLKVWGWEAPK
jgi:hypothetical protein